MAMRMLSTAPMITSTLTRSKGAVRNNVIEWSQDPNVIPALLAPAAPKVGVLEIKAKQLPELTLPRPSRSEVANGAANADWFPQYKRIANMPELPTPPPYRVLQPKAFMSLVCRVRLAPAQRLLGATGHYEDTLPPSGHGGPRRRPPCPASEGAKGNQEKESE